MQNYKRVEKKLEQFIKKYYYNELIKGGILFFTTGLLYFLITLGLEYYLWLAPAYREVLFWLFIIVELSLFVRFIIYPLSKLIKLAKGINYKYASQIIGDYFPEVNDRLVNILQLRSMNKDSDLIIESIEQKAASLKPVPFQKAISLKSNLQYIKYAAFPVLIMLLIWVSGKNDFFTDSYTRVVNYKNEYQPPAPFQIKVLNDSLITTNQNTFVLKANTIGDVKPQSMQVHLENGNTFLMNKKSNDHFSFEFNNLDEATSFYLSANDVKSKTYAIDVLAVPMIDNISLKADVPEYTRMADKQLDGTGNIEVPEGSLIKWNVKATATDQLLLKIKDSTFLFDNHKGGFVLEQSIYQSGSYVISSSNQFLKDYDKLKYAISVIKDEKPKIEIKVEKDSTEKDQNFFKGTASDDYGVSSVDLFYRPLMNAKELKKVNLKKPNTNLSQFYYAFPNESLSLKEGVGYEYFFQVTDNDAINGKKAVRSKMFSYRKPTQDEKEERQLQQQEQTIDNMDKSLKKLKKNKLSLEEIQKLQREKSNLNYSDQQKLERFIDRQKLQQKQMERFNKSLQENLNQQNQQKDEPKKQELLKRLKNNEKRLEQNEKILDKLDQYKKKIKDENLQKKLEEYEKESSKQERNLEQILELTKRYYVEEKTRKIAKELEQLSKKQKELADKNDDNEKREQDSLNKKFSKLREDLNELRQENKKLKEPMPMIDEPEDEESIEEEQEKAKENLTKKQKAGSEEQKKQKGKDANQNQKNAAKKMQQMSQSMNSMMMMSGQQQASEDAKMLRRILENLLVYSKEQEILIDQFKSIDDNNPNFAKYLKRQASLKENFEHVDDSLFALALRNPIISQQITEKITEVDYNIEKSLEKLANNEVRIGTSKQQYAMRYANDLANMLDNSLDQMQQMLGKGSGRGASGKGKGKGQGKGKGFQLSDVIKSHDDLKKAMQRGMKKGSKEGNKGKSGNKGKGQKGKGAKGGQQNKNGKGGKKQGKTEKESGELYEIYKKQQDLKNQLEDLIRERGLQDDAGKLRRSTKQLEQELLMKGFSNKSLKKMEEIKHELLKLKKAAQKQNYSNQRKSNPNTKNYTNPENKAIKEAKDYFKRDEILNRQNLPLQIKYQSLIKRYFNYE
ncbi:MAG: DUF4175 family protein [Psychroflexus sp.]|nr:DUF4175 family protein [Psychroflexus sp.]MDR9447910.1 DUF4175 family protein [Psychroflexus sp.]